LFISGARVPVGITNGASVLREKVSDIVTESIKVQKAIGEDIASSDFQIICPRANELFHSDSMEDIDDCGRKRRKVVAAVPILCTTALGLRRREKLANEDGKEGEIRTMTLLKAKVALQGVQQHAF
jgi:hypothetical protein